MMTDMDKADAELLRVVTDKHGVPVDDVWAEALLLALSDAVSKGAFIAPFEVQAVVDAMGVAAEVGFRAGNVPAPPAVDDAEVRKRVRGLLGQIQRLFDPDDKPEPLPRNCFHVTRHGNTVMIPVKLPDQIAPVEARLLGVWLIALADPTLKDAPRELAAVATR